MVSVKKTHTHTHTQKRILGETIWIENAEKTTNIKGKHVSTIGGMVFCHF